MALKLIDTLYGGVILDRNELSNEHIASLNEDGYLVLTNGETIEVEDSETGELYEGKITLLDNDDFFLFDVYDESGKIVHEEEVPLLSYLSQLNRCGALDAYEKVEIQ